MATPTTDKNIPIILSNDIFSFRKKYATIGVKSGIVPIIIPAVEASTLVSPLVSPKKYRNGSKRARIMKIGRCFSRIFIPFFVTSNIKNNITEATIVRK